MRLPKQVRLPDAADPKFREAVVNAFAAVRDEINAGTKTGILTYDDGTYWRIVLTYRDGKLIGVTIGASTAATATWSDT